MCIWPWHWPTSFLGRPPLLHMEVHLPGAWRNVATAPGPDLPKLPTKTQRFTSFIIFIFHDCMWFYDLSDFRKPLFFLYSSYIPQDSWLLFLHFFRAKLPPQSCAFSACSIASNNFSPQDPRTTIGNNWKPLVWANYELIPKPECFGQFGGIPCGVLQTIFAKNDMGPVRFLLSM